MHVLVLALVHACECLHEYVEGGAQCLYWKQNSGKIEITVHIFMNVGEFVGRREAIKEPLGVDKLLILCIFPIESRVLSHVIVRARARGCSRLFGER